MLETRWYFGYGSNIDEQQMKKRCPAAKVVCTCVLSNFKLVERLYADVEEAPGSNVYGLLYEMTPDDFTSLDKYEGYPVRYTRYVWDVKMVETGDIVKAVVYQMTPECRKERDGKKYPDDYRLRCRNACEAHGIIDLYKAEGKDAFES